MISKAIASLILVSILSAGAFTSKAKAAETIPKTNATANAGSLTPQGQSLVTLVNRSPWTLRCFVNGEYKGYIYPNHYLPIYAPSGYVVLSARADFIDAPSVFWKSGLMYYYPGMTYSFNFMS